MSLQSGLLSHRYSIRMQVPSPHLCSSAMQARIMGLTEREERPGIKGMHVRGGGGRWGGAPALGGGFPPQIRVNLTRTGHHLTDVYLGRSRRALTTVGAEQEQEEEEHSHPPLPPRFDL